MGPASQGRALFLSLSNFGEEMNFQQQLENVTFLFNIVNCNVHFKPAGEMKLGFSAAHK